jgi:HSP20 family protein
MEEQGSSRHDTSLAQAGELKRGAGRLAPGSSGASRPIRLLDSFDICYRPDVLLKGISPGRASLDRGRIRLGPAASWSPVVEIEQRDDNLVITAALPGLALEDIKIEAIGNVLILQGERRPDRGAGGGTVGRSERRYGYFYREMVLPDGVDTQRVRAEFENGMLRVTIPVLTNRRELPIKDTSTQRQGAEPVNHQEKRNRHHNEGAS